MPRRPATPPATTVPTGGQGADQAQFLTVAVRSVGAPLRVAAHGWGSHRSIGSALRAAVDGGVVVVAPGVYEESLTVDRDVTITAEPGGVAVELVWPDGPALHIRAGTVGVRGLKIRAPVVVSAGALAVRDCELAGGPLTLTGRAVADVTGCRIHHGDGTALRVSGDARIRLTHCAIEDTAGGGVTITQSGQARLVTTTLTAVAGTGLHLSGTAAASAVDCEIADAGGCGVLVEGAATLLVHSSRLRDIRGDAVRVDDCAARVRAEVSAPEPGADPREVGGVSIVDTTITRAAGNGVLATGSAHLDLHRCQVRDAGETGVSAGGTSRLDLAGCQILASTSTGLVARESTRLAATDTTIQRAGANGLFAGDDSRVALSGCTVRESRFTAVHLGGRAGVALRDCTVAQTPEHGVRCTDHAMLRFTGGTLAAVGMTGLQIEGDSDATVHRVSVTRANVGIRIQDTPHHPLVEECTVTTCAQSGLETGPGVSPTVRGSTFRHSGAAGVFLDEDSRATVDGCDVSDADGSGLVVWYGGTPSIRSLTVTNCQGNGLHLAANVRATVDECTITGTDTAAIYVGATASPTLRRCHVHDVDRDVELAAERGAGVHRLRGHRRTGEHHAHRGGQPVVPAARRGWRRA